MKTKRVLIYTYEEVLKGVEDLVVSVIKDTAGVFAENGKTALPIGGVLLEKGLKNMTVSELVDEAECWAEMQLDQHNYQNKRNPAVAVLMFYPRENGAVTYNLTPHSVYKKDMEP